MSEEQHQGYYESLSQEEKMLLVLRDELYDGSWEKMEQDLKDRLKGKPYIFKLVHRIEEDLVRIEKLQGYEQKQRVNLSDYAQAEE